MTDLASLALKIDASEVATGVRELDKLTQSGTKAEGSTKRLGVTVEQAERHMRKASIVLGDMKAKEEAAALAADKLAKAQIGFAMGAAGTDTAIETADVALMDDDLRKIPAFVRLSRQTASILKQNIALALGIKALFLGMALAGEATMWMAVFADMGVSLLVVFNGLRLLQK